MQSIKEVIKSLEINILNEIDRLESYTVRFGETRKRNWFSNLQSLVLRLDAVCEQEWISSNPHFQNLGNSCQINEETLQNIIEENKLAGKLLSETRNLFRQAEQPLGVLLSKNDDDHVEGVQRLKKEQELILNLKFLLRDIDLLSRQNSQPGFETSRTILASHLSNSANSVQIRQLTGNALEPKTPVSAQSHKFDRNYLLNLQERVNRMNLQELRVECASLLEENFNLNFDYRQIQDSFIRQSRELTKGIELENQNQLLKTQLAKFLEESASEQNQGGSVKLTEARIKGKIESLTQANLQLMEDATELKKEIESKDAEAEVAAEKTQELLKIFDLQKQELQMSKDKYEKLLQNFKALIHKFESAEHRISELMDERQALILRIKQVGQSSEMSNLMKMSKKIRDQKWEQSTSFCGDVLSSVRNPVPQNLG